MSACLVYIYAATATIAGSCASSGGTEHYNYYWPSLEIGLAFSLTRCC